MRRSFRLLCENNEIVQNSITQLTPEEAEEARAMKMSPEEYIEYKNKLIQRVEQLRQINAQAVQNPEQVSNMADNTVLSTVKGAASFGQGLVMQAGMMVLVGGIASSIGDVASKIWSIVSGAGIDADNVRVAGAPAATTEEARKIYDDYVLAASKNDKRAQDTIAAIDSQRGGALTTGLAWVVLAAAAGYACLKIYEWFKNWWQKRRNPSDKKAQTALYQNMSESTLYEMSYMNRRDFELYALDETYVPLQEGIVEFITSPVKHAKTNRAAVLAKQSTKVMDKAFQANEATMARTVLALKQGQMTPKEAIKHVKTIQVVTPKLIRGKLEAKKILTGIR